MIHILTEGEIREVVPTRGPNNEMSVIPKFLYPKVLLRERNELSEIQLRIETYIPVRTIENFLFYEHHVETHMISDVGILDEQSMIRRRDLWYKTVSQNLRNCLLYRNPITNADILYRLDSSGQIPGMGINDTIYHHLLGYSSNLAEQILSSDNPRVRDNFSRESISLDRRYHERVVRASELEEQVMNLQPTEEPTVNEAIMSDSEFERLQEEAEDLLGGLE